MNAAELREEWVEQNCPEALVADGFEDALIGVGGQYSGPCLAIYDTQKCLQILQESDGMTREESQEYLSFNVLFAWCGEHTPIFITPITEIDGS